MIRFNSKLITSLILPLVVLVLILISPAAVFADEADDTPDRNEKEATGTIDPGYLINSQSESSMSSGIEIGESSVFQTPEPSSTGLDFSAGDSSQNQINESDTTSSNIDLVEQESAENDLITIPDQVNESDLSSSNSDFDEQVSAADTSTTAAEGNSYKAEINVGASTNPDPTGPPHLQPGVTGNIKVTFTELGDSTPLGSARIYLDAGFDHTGYDDGGSTGLSVTSSYGTGAASEWSAIWETLGTDRTILLRADYTNETDNGYLAKDGWVSVLFNAQSPAAVGEYTFETDAWTDRDQTTINNMHPDYRDPTIVVSDQVSYRIIENILMNVELWQILADGTRVAVPDPMPHPDVELLDLEISYQFILPPGHQYTGGAFFEFTLPQEFAVYNEVLGDLEDSQSNIFGEYLLSINRNVRLTFNDKIRDYEESGLLGWVSFQTEVRENLDGDLRREIIINIRDNSPVKIPLNFEATAGSSIDKSGIPNRGDTTNQPYNPDSITWTVDFNKDLQEIEDAVLRDPLGLNLTLRDDSIELYFLRVQLDGSVIQETAVLVDDYVIVTSEDDSLDVWFEIRFINTINSAYRLVFTTDIDQDGFTYTNTATLTGSNISDLPAAATVSVDRGAVLEKDAAAYDPDLQSVDWEIRINYNLKEIKAADSTVTDTYGTAQSLVGGSLKVWLVTLNDDGVEVPSTAVEQVENTHYTFNPIRADSDDPGSTVIGFEITFIGDVDGNITDAYRINYRTVPVDRVYTTVTLNNTAEFSGESNGASQTLSQSILSKTHHDINYADKTVQWTIVINRDRHPMDNLVITDTFTNSGLTITSADLPSAVIVDGLLPGVTYDINPLAVGEGFIINNFRDGSDNPVTILDTIIVTYTTIFAFEKLTNPADNFENNVRLNWLDANERARSIDDTETFRPNQQTRQNGYKGGSYNALIKEITWTIGVNYNLREVNNAQVYDYILGNQTLDPDSIAVYSATIEEDGTVNRGVALEMGNDPSQYLLDLTVTGQDPETNPGFRISLGNINSLYIIEYRTSLVEEVIAGQYNNTAYLYSGDDQQAVLSATVSNSNWGIYTSKQGSNEGRTVTWQIDINPGLSQLTNVVIEDSLSPGQRILQDSVKVYSTTITGANGNYERAVELLRDTDYTVAFSGTLNEGESMELSLIGDYNTINSAYIVEYQTFIEFIYQGQVSNSAVLTATTLGLPADTGDSEDIGGRITSGQGGIRGFLGRLVVRKTDVATGTLLPGAQFELRHESGSTVIATATAGANGTAVFNNVLFGNYFVSEVAPPPGYALDDPSPRAVALNSGSATLTFSNTRLPDDGGGDDGNGSGGGGNDDGGNGSGNTNPGLDNDRGGGKFLDDLSDYYLALINDKANDSETFSADKKLELPRTGGMGAHHTVLIVVVLISIALLFYKRALMISEKVE